MGYAPMFHPHRSAPPCLPDKRSYPTRPLLMTGTRRSGPERLGILPALPDIRAHHAQYQDMGHCDMRGAHIRRRHRDNHFGDIHNLQAAPARNRVQLLRGGHLPRTDADALFTHASSLCATAALRLQPLSGARWMAAGPGKKVLPILLSAGADGKPLLPQLRKERMSRCFAGAG